MKVFTGSSGSCQHTFNFFNFLGPVTKNQQVILSETPKKILSFVPTDAMNFTDLKNGYVVRVDLF